MTTRLAFIGSGQIAPFHILAAKKVGFKVTAISSSPNSQTARELAHRFDIQNYFTDTVKLLKSKTFDCLSIIIPPENSYMVLKNAIRINCPILIEKPVALASKDIKKNLDSDRIFVGYNRRFYESIQKLRAINLENSGIFQFNVIENINNISPTFNEIKRTILANSVHMIDLVNYLIINPQFREGIFSELNLTSNFRIFQQTKYVGSIEIHFNSKENTSIDFQNSFENIKIQPLEKLYRFNNIEIIEPKGRRQYRIYNVGFKNSPEKNTIEESGLYKPGFLGQYQEYFNYCKFNIHPNKLATLNDAYRALKIAEKIVSVYRLNMVKH